MGYMFSSKTEYTSLAFYYIYYHRYTLTIDFGGGHKW